MIMYPNTYGDLIENPTPRCACMLLLDVSASMDGQPIRLLSQGVTQFIQEVCRDDFARFAVEVGMITFGGTVNEVIPIQSILQVDTPTLSATGLTPMGEAVLRGIDVLEHRKKQYRKYGVPYYQHWIVLMTDGTPTDHEVYPKAATQLRRMAEENGMVVFGIGVGDNCDLNTLAQFCPANRPPKKLAGYKFREFFEWLSQSMARVSVSTPGTGVELPSTKEWAKGWGDIQV